MYVFRIVLVCMVAGWLTDWRSNVLDINEYFISGKTTLLPTTNIYIVLKRPKKTVEKTKTHILRT